MSEKPRTPFDSKLLLLQYLYHEKINPEGLYELLKDPMMLKEYEALKLVKNQLGSSCSHREASPPDDVVDHILTKARQKGAYHRGRSFISATRLSVIGSIGVAVACALIFFWIPNEDSDESPPEQTQAIENLELQWDDTQDRIEIQQALRVVRQRTSPELWDESDVMKLDSLSDLSNTTPLGVEVTSSTSQ